MLEGAFANIYQPHGMAEFIACKAAVPSNVCMFPYICEHLFVQPALEKDFGCLDSAEI